MSDIPNADRCAYVYDAYCNVEARVCHMKRDAHLPTTSHAFVAPEPVSVDMQVDTIVQDAAQQCFPNPEFEPAVQDAAEAAAAKAIEDDKPYEDEHHPRCHIRGFFDGVKYERRTQCFPKREITDDMVERALEMFYRDWGQEHPIFYPQDYSNDARALLVKIMRAALEAALNGDTTKGTP